MSKSLYHLHVDAVQMPAPFIDWATQEGGFHADDFPHQFLVEGKARDARHLTRYMENIDPHEMRANCLTVETKAREFDVRGFIQAEFIMEERQWQGSKIEHPPLTPPVAITLRSLNPVQGEFFKRHEIHLEFDKKNSSDAILRALRGQGFMELESMESFTITCSGHPKEIGLVKEKLETFLDNHLGFAQAKLVYEATAYWSLVQISSESLPMIVDRVH